ncbi:DUF6089 family protein [Reichenbachiella agariperforans]|nr:DUF6089 family protein [Reichenbachiella agariperforans]
MKNTLIVTLLLALFMSCIHDAEAQRRRKPRYSYQKKNNSKKYSNYRGGKVGYTNGGNSKYATIGISANMNNYFGDISNNNGRFSTDYKFIPDGFGITASKSLYPGIFARAGFNYGTIKASDYSTGSSDPDGDPNDYGRYQRNYHFKNSIKELSLGLEIDFFPTKGGAKNRFPINPYMYLGAAVFHHAPKAKAPETDQAGNPTGHGGEWVDLQKIGTEGQYSDSLNLKPYSKFQFAIPLGLGVKIKLARNFDLNFEVGFRYLFTDYLDDIGGKYANLDYFGSDHLARALSERGGEGVALMENKPHDVPTTSTNTNLNVNDPSLQWDPNASSSYTHGWNYIPGTDRADASNKDFLVTTQIRLVYVLDKKGMARGKFR